MQQTNIDDIDLRIIKLLARDSRSPYKDIASTVGISLNATKDRINRMVSNGAIERFAVRINPVIFGYEKECILMLCCMIQKNRYKVATLAILKNRP